MAITPNSHRALLIGKGWSMTTCGSCSGIKKEKWTNKAPEFRGFMIEVLPAQGLFRYKKNNRPVSGGTLASLRHQHFLQ